MSQHALLFALGFSLLAVGAVLLGYGVGQLARRFGVAAWVVGLVVVPIAAAAPVFAVTVNTALQHREKFTLGMILGSTVVNIGFALGTAALWRPLVGSSRTVTASISVLLVAVLLFWFVCRDEVVSRIDAAILLVGFLAAVAYLVWVAREETEEAKAPFTQWNFRTWPAWITAPVAILGVAALIGGAYFVVPEAVELSRMQPKGKTHLFGSVAVVLASSLALLWVTESAARNRHGDLAIGTVVGASLCVLLLVPAIAAFIAPFRVANVTLMNDIPATTLITFLLLSPFLNGMRVSRSEGAILLAASVAYIAWQVTR
jgi:cation:H+ antiporter